METTADTKTLPLPVLKSFTLPQVNHLISLPVSASILTAAVLPRSRSSLQHPAAPTARLTAPCPQPHAGERDSSWSALPSEGEPRGVERGEQQALEQALGAIWPCICTKRPASRGPPAARRSEICAGEWAGSAMTEKALPEEGPSGPAGAGRVSWNRSAMRARLSGDVPKGDESGEKEIPADGGEKMQLWRQTVSSKRKALMNSRKNKQDVRRTNTEEQKKQEPYSTGWKIGMGGKSKKKRTLWAPTLRPEFRRKSQRGETKAGQTRRRAARALPNICAVPPSPQDTASSRACPQQESQARQGSPGSPPPFADGETEARSTYVTRQKPPQQGSRRAGDLPSARPRVSRRDRGRKRRTQHFIRLHYLLCKGVALRLVQI